MSSRWEERRKPSLYPYITGVPIEPGEGAALRSIPLASGGLRSERSPHQADLLSGRESGLSQFNH